MSRRLVEAIGLFIIKGRESGARIGGPSARLCGGSNVWRMILVVSAIASWLGLRLCPSALLLIYVTFRIVPLVCSSLLELSIPSGCGHSWSLSIRLGSLPHLVWLLAITHWGWRWQGPEDTDRLALDWLGLWTTAHSAGLSCQLLWRSVQHRTVAFVAERAADYTARWWFPDADKAPRAQRLPTAASLINAPWIILMKIREMVLGVEDLPKSKWGILLGLGWWSAAQQRPEPLFERGFPFSFLQKMIS